MHEVYIISLIMFVKLNGSEVKDFVQWSQSQRLKQLFFKVEPNAWELVIFKVKKKKF